MAREGYSSTSCDRTRTPRPRPRHRCLRFIYDDSDAEQGDQATCPEGHEAHFWPDWYYTGGATAFNVLLGDIIVVVGVIEALRLFDKLPIRHLAARFAVTQQRMNEIYAFQAAPEIPDPGMIYFPFRLQLILKFVVMGIAFTPALPGLFPLTGLMFLCSCDLPHSNPPLSSECTRRASGHASAQLAPPPTPTPVPATQSTWTSSTFYASSKSPPRATRSSPPSCWTTSP